MPFRTVCPNCQAAYKLPDTMNGKKVRCAKCQESMVAVETAELVDEPAEVEAVPPPVPSAARKVRPSREPDYAEERDIDDEEESEEERPRNRLGAKGKKRSKRQSKIAAVAFNQKAMLLCILANFVAGLFWRFLPPELGLLCLLPMLLVGVASTVFVFMLAAALYGTGLGVFIGVLTLIPGVGFITLLVMNQKATKFLRDNGLEVGFLGAKAPAGTKPLISPRLVGMIAGVVLVVVGLGAAGVFFLTRDPDGPWPEVQMAPLRGPGNEILEDVMVHVAGVPDDYNAGIITRKIARLADPPQNNRMISAKKGDRITARVTSTDPQATAKKIDFGAVRKISGRIITVDAIPVEVPAEGDEIGKLLYDIRGPLSVLRREAFKRLKEIKPNARRDEVVKDLTTVILETDAFDRGFAIEALLAWGGKDTLPIILDAVKSKDHFLRHQVLPVLASFRDPRAGEALAEFLDDPGLRPEVVKGLKWMGPVAEPAVAKRLSNSDQGICQAACEILQDIGTQASLPELDRLAKNRSDRATAMLANNAIKAIKARQ